MINSLIGLLVKPQGRPMRAVATSDPVILRGMLAQTWEVSPSFAGYKRICVCIVLPNSSLRRTERVLGVYGYNKSPLPPKSTELHIERNSEFKSSFKFLESLGYEIISTKYNT